MAGLLAELVPEYRPSFPWVHGCDDYWHTIWSGVGYQPYYTESWSGVVINGQQSWKKYLPAGSDVKFEIGLQGSVIVGKMLGEKNHLGYMGDMPAIVSTTKEDKVDIRMIAVLGTSRQQCNVFLVKNDAPLGSGQRRRHA